MTERHHILVHPKLKRIVKSHHQVNSFNIYSAQNRLIVTCCGVSMFVVSQHPIVRLLRYPHLSKSNVIMYQSTIVPVYKQSSVMMSSDRVSYCHLSLGTQCPIVYVCTSLPSVPLSQCQNIPLNQVSHYLNVILSRCTHCPSAVSLCLNVRVSHLFPV